MTILKSTFFLSIIALAVLISPACKSKKMVVKTPAAAVEEPAKPVAVEEQRKPEPAQEQAETPGPVQKPNYNFSNIQFEFNSGILKTGAYPILDKAVMEIKKDPSVKITLNGYASAEGTEEHNMVLSVERANSVKTYLANSGVNADNLTVKGYGEGNPIATKTDEASRAVNRRVEIKKQ